MNKADLFHQLAWSSIPPGVRTNRIELPGGLSCEVRGGEFGSGPTGTDAQLLEDIFLGGAQELSDNLDLTSEDVVRTVREAVIAGYDAIRQATLFPQQAAAKLDTDQEAMLQKLAELVQSERGKGP